MLEAMTCVIQIMASMLIVRIIQELNLKKGGGIATVQHQGLHQKKMVCSPCTILCSIISMAVNALTMLSSMCTLIIEDLFIFICVHFLGPIKFIMALPEAAFEVAKEAEEDLVGGLRKKVCKHLPIC
jgi:hypothetical protein